MNILEVENLSVEIPVPGGTLYPVRDLSFTVERGRTLAIVGESGCGKSLTSLALMDLLPSSARRDAQRLDLEGQTLLALPERQMADVRGNKMAMIFQDPMTSLNPAFTIGNQLEEAMLRHRQVGRRQARERAVHLLEKVGITAAGSRLGQYPHQLSGGLRQRVMIAMGLMCGPELIIADEPTTALDVTIQAEILLLLAELQKEFGMSLILITHDLGVVARVADRVAVMYAGQIVETGTAAQVFGSPMHPYTRGLLDCIPIPGKTERGAHLGSIPGIVPSLIGHQHGCSFRDRCDLARGACAEPEVVGTFDLGDQRGYRCILGPEEMRAELAEPKVAATRESRPGGEVGRRAESGLALDTAEVRKIYSVRRGFLRGKRALKAVNGVSLEVERGTVLGLVGESGCGKSTLAKMLLGLEHPTDGDIRVLGNSLLGLDRTLLSRHVQPIFQDPYSSLNPRKPISSIISLPLRAHGIGDRAEIERRVREIMELVGLPRRLASVYPSQLSGGQRQRVAIARALVMRPEVVICDEPTSALDVSVQAQILNLLQDLRHELGLTYVVISHNLAVVEHIATEVAVMYLGRIVERAPTEELFANPKHPYTRALLASVLTPEPHLGVPDTHLGAEFPNPLAPPPGCTFHTRCAEIMDVCPKQAPLPARRDGAMVECHLYRAEDGWQRPERAQGAAG